jgi:hypothetical protein
MLAAAPLRCAAPLRGSSLRRGAMRAAATTASAQRSEVATLALG